MKKLILLMVVNLCCITMGLTQKDFDPSIIKIDAQYPGGNENLSIFIKENMIYPEIALINKESGNVYIDAYVDTTGRLIEVKIRQGVSTSIDAEALRLVSIMPLWEPAISIEGNKIIVPVRILIKFIANKEAFNSEIIKQKRKDYKKKNTPNTQ